MASISTDKNGNRRLFFVSPITNDRAYVSLGKMAKRSAEFVKAKIEHLVWAGITGNPPDPEVAGWVRDLDDRMHAKLAAKGLVPSRQPVAEQPVVTLGDFIERYIAGRTDIKERTKINLDQAGKNLVRYFGKDTLLTAITPGDADEFRLYLLERLSENTVRRHCGRAKQFFKAALRKRLIPENPFGDMKGCGVMANPKRFYFVSREEAQNVLEACPDAEWRLIFALARYGGLRCPSEVLSLRWGDIDWQQRRIVVHSPKTERYSGGESRSIPIFPELRGHLEAVWDRAEVGTEYVITRYRGSNVNLRTQLLRIIGRAGLKPWPKLFQNLRSTRETELAEKHALHVVCAWLGNSQPVAAKHYLQIRDEDFERAAEGDAYSDAQMTQNPTQTGSGTTRQESQKMQKAPEKQGSCRILATNVYLSPPIKVPPVGLEPTTL
jgi:integrase